MAATRLIPLHARSGKSVRASLKDRLGYVHNGEKTDDGRLITAYGCDARTAWLEFSLEHKELERRGFRVPERNVIAYQIRQSFKPGEITPEEANRVGYELAMRFTKGRHAFTVSTHTDRAHIHNHIVFSAVQADISGKWRNFYLSSFALQRLSDMICIEHGLSVIKGESGRKKEKTRYPKRQTIRDRMRADICACMAKKPKSFQQLLSMVMDLGYEVREGRDISLRCSGQKKFIRLQTLGPEYTPESLEIMISEGLVPLAPGDVTKTQKENPCSLMIDIEQKLREGKGAGYEKWARSFNMKQMADVLLFLQENEIHSMEDLDRQTDHAVQTFQELSAKIKHYETQLHEIGDLKMQIINYAKTREIYIAYRKAGYSKRFYEGHRAEIDIHKAAKNYFDKRGLKKLPKVKDLSEEYTRILAKKKEAYTMYRKTKEDMKSWTIARKNVSMILGDGLEKYKRKQAEIYR